MSRPLEPGATASRYSSGAIFFHWAIAILIIANILGAVLTEDVQGPLRATAMGLHKATGITVLVLSIGRILWRLVHRPPPMPASVRPLDAGLARVVHWLFYILMIALPVSGWAMISAASPRRPFTWYALFDMPYLPVEGNKAINLAAHEAHELLFYVFLALLVLHLAGALKHHFSDGRTFLFRMMPGHSPR